MTDIIDRAAEIEQKQRDYYIHQARKNTFKATTPYCVDCGEDIPVERQKALGGVTRCVHCQSIAEQRMRHRR